jgi:hypothetical protein
MATVEATHDRFEQHERRLLLGWGLAVWAVVAVTARLVGHLVLDPALPLLAVGAFVAAVPLMTAVTYPVYRWRGMAPAARPRAAVLMSLPGLLLDTLLVGFAGTTLPAMGPQSVQWFGALLVFGYGVVLLSSVWPVDEHLG